MYVYSYCNWSYIAPRRSSPFFWAFQEGLVQSRPLANGIFKFTDMIPGATIGPAVQDINLSTRQLVSDVEMIVFPYIKGSVVTTSDVELRPPNALVVTVQNTRVSDSNVAQFLEGVVVPVQQLIEQIRGSGSTRVEVLVGYVDEDLRVMRTQPDNEVFVYKRLR